MARGRVYNRIFTKEKWEKVNQENKDTIEDFLEEYRQKKKSKGTIDGYYQDLRIIMILIMEHFGNKSVLKMTKKDFRKLTLMFSEKMYLSSSRVNRLKSAVNSMLEFCTDDDDYSYDINFAKKVSGLPKERVRDDDDDFFFTYEEFVKVRDILVERGKLQYAVLWSLGFDSAGRKNELYQVKKTGLIDSNKTNVVIGKRGKKFPLVYLSDTQELIAKYLEKRGEDDVESLWFTNHNGVHSEITKNTLYNRMLYISNVLSEVRGEECEIFVHTMRHSRAECLSQGTDDRLKNPDGTNRKYALEEIRIFLHHESCSTSEGYLKSHDEDKIDEMFGF